MLRAHSVLCDDVGRAGTLLRAAFATPRCLAPPRYIAYFTERLSG